ncbi:glycosyl hydrolase family 43 protein [Rutstroemia sp. NJR-2017a BBW]|nr:glycosyl hydrolase family 43 protein [Rutstroemia sp. NJR-2017a BBW]
MLKVADTYFLLVSGKTAYAPNPNKMFWSTSINGTWNGPFDIAPNTTNTYDSQNSFELVVQGAECTTYVYMGDRFDAEGSEESGAKRLTLEYHDMWKVNVSTGLVSFPTVARRYEAESAELSGRAGEDAVHFTLLLFVLFLIIQQLEQIVITVSANALFMGAPAPHSGCPSTTPLTTPKNPYPLRLQTQHNLLTPFPAGEVYIRINKRSVLKLSSLNSRAGYAKIVPVEVTLNHGDGNVVEFGAVGDEVIKRADFEVEIECLEVYEEES